MLQVRTVFAVIALAAPCVSSATEVPRLDLSSFTAVPPAVRSGLKQQGCTIPQTFLARKPENVVRGSFTGPSSSEWAALCSVGGVSEILVFRATSTRPVARLAKFPDENFVQAVAPGRSGYSRRLRAVPTRVRGLNGIEDAFLEKASTVWVYERGRWQEKPGAD
jgi:hypothetical protein